MTVWLGALNYRPIICCNPDDVDSCFDNVVYTSKRCCHHAIIAYIVCVTVLPLGLWGIFWKLGLGSYPGMLNSSTNILPKRKK